MTVPDWTGGYSELCVCGHPGTDHCLDDEHCIWSTEHGQYGGACLALLAEACDCAVYRPASAQGPGTGSSTPITTERNEER